MFNLLAQSLLGYKNTVKFPMSSFPTVVEGSADNREPPRLHLFNICVQNQKKKRILMKLKQLPLKRYNQHNLKLGKDSAFTGSV